MSRRDAIDELPESEQLVLSDLVNRVLDKGVVISSEITISVAGIDLIELDLKLLISSAASLEQRRQKKAEKRGQLSLRSHTRP